MGIGFHSSRNLHRHMCGCTLSRVHPVFPMRALPQRPPPHTHPSIRWLLVFTWAVIMHWCVHRHPGADVAGFLWWRRSKAKIQSLAKQDESLTDTHDFNYLLYRALRRGKADIYHRDDSDLLHEVTAEQREIKKLLLDLLLIIDPRQQRLTLPAMRSKYRRLENADDLERVMSMAEEHHLIPGAPQTTPATTYPMMPAQASRNSTPEKRLAEDTPPPAGAIPVPTAVPLAQAAAVTWEFDLGAFRMVAVGPRLASYRVICSTVARHAMNVVVPPPTA
jgi:hypothetical protein